MLNQAERDRALCVLLTERLTELAPKAGRTVHALGGPDAITIARSGQCSSATELQAAVAAARREWLHDRVDTYAARADRLEKLSQAAEYGLARFGNGDPARTRQIVAEADQLARESGEVNRRRVKRLEAAEAERGELDAIRQ